MTKRIPILIDSDANNELDDQHAIAYGVCNATHFDLRGVTVNNTPLGNGIQGQYDEALRILQLCNVEEKVPLFKGAEQNYNEIQPTLSSGSFDGQDAVNFIVEQAMASEGELVLIPIGKLTNIALALDLAPEIEELVRVVWLGSNYPDPGEYNLVADQDSVQRVLDSNVPFEIVTVRYTERTGSTAVAVTVDEIKRVMPGLGPEVKPVEGRNGGMFSHFGDYSVSLFEQMKMPKRPLFDVVATAVVKNPSWGQKSMIPSPRLTSEGWVEQADNKRQIAIWEHFDRDAIVDDLYTSLRDYVLPE